VLVGNKCDLQQDWRAVTPLEGQNFAESVHIPFFETSAREFVNVQEAWVELAKAAVRYKLENSSQPNGQGEKKSKCIMS
jgi:GTPase SAR1 family protein